ncbi:MAG TPA: amidohydrolase family protein [Microbacterium sp.]|nr:amidohydrolase family protein [Microbacterium sp.]
MTRYAPAIDVAALHAIDAHVHVDLGEDGHTSLPTEINDAANAYFRADPARLSIDQIAGHYRERSIAAVVFTVDATTNLGHRPNSVEEIAEGAARNNDILIPFGSVDPLQGDAAIDRARRLVDEYGVRGFKFHPSVQGFDPSRRRHFPLYAALQELGLPCIFHTGQTGIGAGTPGGSGIRLSYSNPMLLDAVAAQFPELTIIMAHPSVPWQDEALAIATHKQNVFMDLSGWSPRYFAPQLVRQVDSILRSKALFGSDFPLISPDRWQDDFARLELKPETRAAVLKDNAVRVLGLEEASR